MNEQMNLIKEVEAKYPNAQFIGVQSLGLPIDKPLVLQTVQGGKGVAFDVRLVKDNQWALPLIAGSVTFEKDGKEQTKVFGIATGEANLVVDRNTFQNYTPGQSIQFTVQKNETTGRETVRVISLDPSEVASSAPVGNPYEAMSVKDLKALLTENEVAFAATATKASLVELATAELG